MKDEFVEILSRDYWFKVVEMLQQNWALIEPSQSGKSSLEGCLFVALNVMIRHGY